MTAQPSQRQLLARARLASGSSVTVQYSFAYFLMELASVSCVTSVGAGWGVAMCLNGALVHRWVCPREGDAAHPRLGRYLVFAGLGIGGLAVLLCTLLHLIHIPHWLAWGASALGLFFALSSLATLTLVPRRPSVVPQLGPGHQAAMRAYYESVCDTYGTPEGEGWFHRVREREVALLLTLLQARPGERILDAGSGPGRIARRLRAQGAQVCAVDLSPRLLELARPWAVETVCADIETLRLGREFEAVVCAGALEFTCAPGKAFAALAEHVAPGGRLVLLVPMGGIGGWVYRRVQRRRGLAVHLFSPRALVKWGRESGLALEASARPFFHCRVLAFRRAPNRSGGGSVGNRNVAPRCRSAQLKEDSHGSHV